MTALEPDKFYHIYNRGNGDERIFRNSGNYKFFLKKYQQYIDPVAETYCYCLMPNHFHFLIKIRSTEEIANLNPPALEKPGLYCSKQFSNLFSSYTQALNKQQGRMGSLFMKNFKRKEVDSDKYFFQLVHYIHMNPVAAKMVEKPSGWEYSSYQKLLTGSKTFLQREKILELFGDLDNFVHVHSRPMNYSSIF